MLRESPLNKKTWTRGMNRWVLSVGKVVRWKGFHWTRKGWKGNRLKKTGVERDPGEKVRESIVEGNSSEQSTSRRLA